MRESADTLTPETAEHEPCLGQRNAVIVRLHCVHRSVVKGLMRSQRVSIGWGVALWVITFRVAACGVQFSGRDAAPSVVVPSNMITTNTTIITRIITNDLMMTVTETSDGLFRFDVEPVGERVEPVLSSGRAVYDASDGSVVLFRGDGRLWRAKIAKLAKFGRAGVPGLESRWRAWDGEAIYGLGQRFNGLNQAGRIVHMWIEDVPGQGGDNAPSYYATPVLYSTLGYALFMADNPEGVFDLNSTGDGFNRYRRAGQTMTFYVAFGDTLKALVMKRETVQGPHKSIFRIGRGAHGSAVTVTRIRQKLKPRSSV